MKLREMLIGLGAALMGAGRSLRMTPPAQGRQERYSEPVALPAPAMDGSVPLEQVVGKRRSQRSFRPGQLQVGSIGQLLWAGQGITSADGKRTAPSAGALYPLELYAVTPTEVMHYLPEGHRVETRAAAGLRAALEAAAFGQAPVGAAPTTIVVVAAPGRTRAKYGARAAAFLELEAGHAAQNILLQATAHKLAAVPIGSFDPDKAAAALALPADQMVLYLIPVGLAQ